MAFAVLLDPVGQAAQAPIFAFLYAAALGLELGADLVGDGIDLLLRDIVACDQHAFIKRHDELPLAGSALARDGPHSGMEWRHSRGRPSSPAGKSRR